VKGATQSFDAHAYRAGRQTPVFFGSAINNFGVEELLAAFIRHAPGRCRAAHANARWSRANRGWRASCSRSRRTWTLRTATGSPSCALCAGRYARGMRLFHVRLGKEVRVADALTFMAAERAQAEEAYAGDIIGLHNHGTINIGDTFTPGRAAHLHRCAEFRAGDIPPCGAQGPN